MHLHTHNTLLLWWIKPATKTSKESEWKYIMEKNKNKASECIKEKINGIHIEKCSEIWIYTTMDESRGVERERAGKNVSVVGNLCGTAHFELCMKNKMRIIHYSYSEQKKMKRNSVRFFSLSFSALALSASHSSIWLCVCLYATRLIIIHLQLPGSSTTIAKFGSFTVAASLHIHIQPCYVYYVFLFEMVAVGIYFNFYVSVIHFSVFSLAFPFQRFIIIIFSFIFHFNY